MDCFVAIAPRNDDQIADQARNRRALDKKEERMARLPYLEAEQVAPEYRDMLKRNTNLHKLLVNSPDMARAFNGVGGFIRFKSKLDPRLRELAILQVGWLEKSEYEFTHHVKIGKEFGVTDEDIAGLMAETEGKPSKLEPLAKIILKGAREMVRELAMREDTFAEIKKHLSNEHMVDLVLTIAFYCAVVRVLATMKIDNEPYYKEVLQQYPMPGIS
jgi:alkylhydroperoxidase family enzyme